MNIEFAPLIDDLSLAYRYRAAVEIPRALVILMHGIGSNEDALLGLASYIPPDYSVALVRSPITMAPGAYSAFAVNFTANGPIIDAVAAESSRLRLIEFIPALQNRYGIPAGRTVIGGFSQGGIMSASLALSAPKLVRGFAILSGRILPEIRPAMASAEALRGLSALVVHGEADDRLPPFWATQSTTLLAEAGIPVKSLRYKMGHEITREVAADLADWISSLFS